MANTTGTTPIIGGTSNTSGPGPEVMAADTLEGDRVVSPTGEDLGKIRDIMIDVPTGRVAYAVMSSGGVMGLGDKLFAVPWDAFVLDADNHQFVLDVDKDRLKNAPGFDKGHWPTKPDARFAQSVYEYFDTPPYWM